MGPRLVLYGLIGMALTMAWVVAAGPLPGAKETHMALNKDFPLKKTEDQWKAELNSSQFCVLRQKGTEQAFSGKYWDHHEKGIYRCAGCGEHLFKSDTKFESGSGWPSFWQPLDSAKVHFVEDRSYGMIRTEVVCNRCGSHLGHVFEDGPKPTGLRYCINSESLIFIPSDSLPDGVL